MRTRVAAASTIVALFLVACSGDHDRELARYYDPEGLFSAALPVGNDITVAPPQAGDDGPGLLTGVVSAPPQPSPASQAQLGGGFGNFAQQSEPADQTVYEVFAVTTSDFADVAEMSSFFLTGDPAIDVRLVRTAQLAGRPARLVVADAVRDGTPTTSIAAAFSLGDGEVGYIVAAIFPPGGWSRDEHDFMEVVRSLRTDVPDGLQTFPLAGA